MPEEATPIAWTALAEGTAVIASDGSEIGRVATVVADEQQDIFSGIAIRSSVLDAPAFAPAEVIEQITESAVRLRLTDEEAQALEPYEG